uniref:Uncharacterized protein n=1 Tax=Avena sativa TaxID=4498 RepID=A0ACD5Z3J6_AVESA
MIFLEENGVDTKEVEVCSFTKDEYYEDPVHNTKHNPAATIMSSNPPKFIIPSNEASGPASQTEADENNNVCVEQARATYQRTLSGGLQTPRDVIVSQKAILERVNSKSKSKSYQLGHRLSLQWRTGSGPRIGCVKDYPMELRTRALEMVQQSRTPTKGIDSFGLVEGTTTPLPHLSNITAHASADLPAIAKLGISN